MLKLRAFVEKAAKEISDFAVAFVNLQEHGERKDADLAGSGTLVSIDGTKGILTACHVIENLPNTGEVGLVLLARPPGQLHRFTLPMEFVEKVLIARGPCECDGPDLGLLVLPEREAAKIEVTKVFYNIVKRRDRILSNPPAIDTGVWFLEGVADEWTKDAPPEQGYERVKIFRGISGVGIVKAEYEKGGFDFLEFEAKYDDSYEGPDRFGGFSGGGLWQLLVEEPGNGDLTVRERILSGVAFYESPIEGGLLIIKCNGRRSIYENGVDTVRAKAHS